MSLIATRMQELRIKSPNYYEHLFAAKEYGAMELYLRQTRDPNGVASLALREGTVASIGREVKVPALTPNFDMEPLNSRSCTVPNRSTSSALVPLVWVTIADGFVMYPNQYSNNEIKYLEHLSANLRDMYLRIWNRLDQLCAANLAANKTSVFGDLLNYTQSGNVVNANWNDRESILGDMKVLERANGFRGHINLVGNFGLISLSNKLGRYGEFNEKNLNYEFGDMSGFISGNIANADGKYCTLYAVPDGSVAVLSRVSRPEAAGSKAAGHEWDTVTLPMMEGITWGTHYYESVGDVSADTGEPDMNCDYAQHFGFAADFAFLNAYNPAPATIANPIMAADLASGSNGLVDVRVVEPIPTA